jgi:D-glycero-D-manno-heptose 1,7-bisphosphate phosphatase
MRRAVFLDRDGVINKGFVAHGVPTPARDLEQLQILPRVGEAIEMLRSADFELVVVTNQPDVARGHLSKEVVNSMHQQLQRELKIEHFYTCFHDDAQNCSCRKPKPGLLRIAGRDLGLDLKKSFMVGDRWRDIVAGQTAGCRCFFVDYSYAEKPPQMPYLRVSSLFEAAQTILEESSSVNSE